MKRFFKALTVSYLILVWSQMTCVAQNMHMGIPRDLNVSKIIFLKHDSLSVNQHPKTRQEKRLNKHRKQHNKMVTASNKELILAAQEYYPFEYTIISEKEVKKYKSMGYKYVLDFEPFHRLKNEYCCADSKELATFPLAKDPTSPLRIIDLTNGDMYVIDYLSESSMYYYKGIIKKTLMKAVRSKFDVNSTE